MIGYVTLGTNDLPRAAAFYDALFAEIGAKRLWDTDRGIGWGTAMNMPSLGLLKPFDGKPATVGNGTMVAGIASGLGGALTLVDASLGSTSLGIGSAGDVQVTAASAVLDGRGFGDTQLASAGDAFGAAGRVDISLSGALSLRDGAYIRSRGIGLLPSAPLTVTADRIDIDGGASGDGGIIGVSNNGARSADVSVTTTGAVSITSGGQIATLTLGDGASGNLTVKAGSISLQGAPELTSALYTQSSGSGRSGNLLVETGRLSATGPARVATSSNGGGDAGNLTLKADSLSLDGRGGSATLNSFTGNDGGAAGTVDVQVKNDMTVANGAWVFAGTTGPGNPGALAVKAGTLVIDGSFVNASGGRIVLEVESDGAGGFVTDHLIFAPGSTS